MTIKTLNEFLSTDTRKKIFLYYVFSNISPSDMVDETKIPFSTVDRVTQLLKAHKILIESEGKDMREKKYTIDFDRWVKENMEFIGFDFLEDGEIKQIVEFMKDKNFFTLSYLFMNPDFILDFFKEPLKLEEDFPFLILMNMSQNQNLLSQLPSSVLIYLKFSPCFKKLVNDIDNDSLDSDIAVINKSIKKYPFIKDVTITRDDLIKYEKKRAELLLLLRRVFEKGLLKMSVRKSEEIEI